MAGTADTAGAATLQFRSITYETHKYSNRRLFIPVIYLKQGNTVEFRGAELWRLHAESGSL